MPPGRAGESGYPGSTAQTKTFRGRDPRQAKIQAPSNTGWDSGLSDETITRQAAYRGDQQTPVPASPRATPQVRTPKGSIRQRMQREPGEFFGGPMLRTSPGNVTAGGNPLSSAAAAGGHSVMATQTPAPRRRTVIARGVPGAQNVRNQVAQSYRAVPGQSHTYRSAARPDIAPVNSSGQASDGNAHPDRATTMVTVPSRFVFAGGGHLTNSVLREMPYGGRGDGARGAALSGDRYYATGQDDQFWNAGMGNYGVARERGGKRPVGFTEPAPWTANFYDTTDSVGTTGQAGDGGQSPDMVYVSPAGRLSTKIVRLG